MLATRKFRIDFRENFRIEQRAMARAATVIDAVSRAERIERVLLARMLAPGDGERIDDAIGRKRALLQPLQLGIEEAHIEARHCG